jgi:glycosyltransferase involved in cell wall biosynthesis
VPKVSVTIITRNEADQIGGALESAAWADELIVVDSESTDDTAAIARRFTDRVVVRTWPGYIAQKNYAASLASNDWIFSLDADERITPALATEIKSALATEPAHAGFRMPRMTHHLGRWVRTTDWYPDPQLRLYDRRRATWTGRYVHESVSPSGSVGNFREHLQHYPYRDVGEHLDTINRYTEYSARQMYENGRRAGWLQIATYPAAAFLRNYIAKGGFREGVPGLIISSMNAYYVFLKFARLWELQRTPELQPDTSSSKPRNGRPEH